MQIYALPNVGNAGLGNQLFPWARAELFARKSGARILAPLWGTFRLGPYFRGEAEKRHYGGFFRAPHHVHGIRRMVVRSSCTRIPETDVELLAPSGGPDCVVEFTGIQNLFSPLLGESKFIRESLWVMTRERHHPPGNLYGKHFIAMHIRRGDLTRQGFTESELAGVLQFTALEWFISMAKLVSQPDTGGPLPLVIFTDGFDKEVAPLMELPGVVIHERRSALTDLWIMSRASVFIASGFSTFSMWASYIGGMPTLYAPGKIQQYVQGPPGKSMEYEIGPDDQLPDALLCYVNSLKVL